MTSSTNSLSAKRRIVVKIGSSLLVDEETGAVRRGWLDALADDIARWHEAGKEVLIVSSGAIALGRRRLGLASGSLRLEDSQGAAAIGQIQLAHAYEAALARHRINVAQILLTSDDTERRRRYLNARNTIAALMTRRTVAVINENDTVATDEIRFGDNDRLAARVAAMVGADCLLLLSDVDGLYTGDPQGDAAVDFVPEVLEMTDEIAAMGGSTQSDYGRGGMITKLQAARISVQAGCDMVITSGRGLNPLSALEAGGRCTWFRASRSPSSARKRWIAGSLKAAGTVRIDAGAARALAQGKSLLPAGVTAVDGAFGRGDAVIITDVGGRQLGRGLIAYSADDARAILGRRSGEIETILGFRGRVELIHRDDMVLD